MGERLLWSVKLRLKFILQKAIPTYRIFRTTSCTFSWFGCFLRLIVRCDLYIQMFILTVMRGHRERLVDQYLLLLCHCHVALYCACLLQKEPLSCRAAEGKFGVSEKLVRDWGKAGMANTASGEPGGSAVQLPWKSLDGLTKCGLQ
ncbi:hypothetical protein NL108_009126 [Boleophthalmus pectinirostris]|nr:hypothetical protein NL108_009126 [Boleophthalmus pectinirostris]